MPPATKKDTKLRLIRKSLTMYREEMAAALGVSLSTYNNWEYGFSKPPKTMLKALLWIALEQSLQRGHRGSALVVVKNLLHSNGWDNFSIILFCDMLSNACLNSVEQAQIIPDALQQVVELWEDRNNADS